MEKNIKVAIVDTGIDKHNTYLKDNIIGGIAFESKDEYILVSDNYDDQNGHGTSCASIIKREFEDVEIFVVKALDNLGRTNIQVLEEALKYLLNIDIDIINLSLSVMESELVQDLYKICEKLYKQGKFIVCSVANGFESSYPAKFDNVIGVKGFILEDENSIWYNKNCEIQCIIDNNSYLSCDLYNSYKLFGKCNSQAAAKLTGKIARILSKKTNMRLDDLSQELEKAARKRFWTKQDLEESKRYPKFKKSINYNNDLLEKVENVIKEVLSIDRDVKRLYELSLFNKYIGLNEENCFKLIKKLEERFNINLDYMNISRYDFVSIYTLTDLIEDNLNYGGILV